MSMVIGMDMGIDIGVVIPFFSYRNPGSGRLMNSSTLKIRMGRNLQKKDSMRVLGKLEEGLMPDGD